jgi:putative ABC transport system permease protein
MNFRDFKIGWRLLVKEPSYSAIVILGLSVGIAVCFLLLGLVRHQFSYDAEVPEVDQVYYAKERWHVEGFHGWNSGTSFQARKAMVNSGLPLIASVYSSHSIDVRYGERVQSIELSLVDPDFRKIFGIKALAGDLDAAITRPDAMALTEETAIKLFGNTDVVGKTLLVNGETFTVAALLATPPVTTVARYAALGGIENRAWKDQFRTNVFESWGSISGLVFLKLTGHIAPEQVVRAIESDFKKSPYYDQKIKSLLPSDKGNLNIMEFKLEKLRDKNLDADTADSALQNKNMLAGLSAIAILILMLAMTNYLNLAMVRTIRRQREIAMRKVLGASASRLLHQFFSESILVCLLASGIGLLIAWLLLPAFSDMVALDLNGMFTWGSVIVYLFSSILLGIVSGAYPAWSALKVLPTAALSGRGNAETRGGLRMRRILTVMQFGTAMGLSAIAIAVTWQTYFVTNLNPGFDPKPLLVVSAPEGLRSASSSAFRDAVARIPNVSKISVANSLMRNLTKETRIYF